MKYNYYNWRAEFENNGMVQALKDAQDFNFYQYDLLLKTDTDEVFIIKERYISEMCDNISELEYTKDLITL